jgi:hypothetical protein
MHLTVVPPHQVNPALPHASALKLSLVHRPMPRPRGNAVNHPFDRSAAAHPLPTRPRLNALCLVQY